jgi:hypothetical protein
MADRLAADERLNVDGRLASPNGEFTLLMQDDGHLVLYRGEPSPDTAYWGTGTFGLPPAERPTTALMQTDAHFVLYDDGGHPRWSSGTWGQGYVAPYIVLQDDGNLVIYHNGNHPVWASGRPDGAGAIPSRGNVPAGLGTRIDNFNADVDGLGRMPPIEAGDIPVDPPYTTTVDGSGVTYVVTQQRRKLVNEVVSHAFLQDLGAMGVWPGEAIQGAPLLNGDVARIGPLLRRPGTLRIVTDLVTNTPRNQSVLVDAPDGAKIDQARRELLAGLAATDAPGLLNADFQSASSLREVGARLGLTIKGPMFGVDANASLDQTYRETTVVGVVRQVFYSVEFAPQAGRATGIWGPDVGMADLAPYARVGNPPLVIDSVQYGRLICLTVKAAASSSEIAGAMTAHWDAVVSGRAEAQGRNKEVLDSVSVRIYTIGVPGRINFQTLNVGVAELGEVYKAGLVFDPQNPGAPISFTCRHIADNTVAHVGVAAEYIVPLSVQGTDIDGRDFPVFDGRGGGLVDTGIRVNPGDRVTLSPSGEIWSGVIFSGTHGPQGWPGHRPDAAAPFPEGTAYSLLARFGNGPWFEVPAVVEASPEPGFGGGVLQFNINDNNPYNGNPDDRWNVHVSVRRGNAAAAGVYI